MKQTLDFDECISGMEKTMENAEKVMKDGEVLEKKGSPTATFLYAIAIEELSKAYILGHIAIQVLEKENINWDRFWKNFRDHKFKQTGLLKMILFSQNLIKEKFDEIKKRRPEILRSYKNSKDVEKAIQEFRKRIKKVEKGEMEKLKWRHLYVDYLDDQWKVPTVRLEKDLLIRENVKTYLVDLNTMKKHIKEEVEKRRNASEP